MQSRDNQKIKDKFKCNVGWSDHTKNYEVLLRAINKWKVNSIEFHLDLDGKGNEFNMNHCWLPSEILPVIRSANGPHVYDNVKNDYLNKNEKIEKNWRSDPSDGLRPLKKLDLKFK